ncbi:oligosaccharide flippase family protein [Shewanella benthica]|uniref:oligosaccharide flippase family protein n=1 Tax=Shewanella benthica TaxID=43661 RepID=UPI00187A43BC|nr:oligosaccharide flippase family protein [Shewanella benthica]MBE7213968.1 oligosaccharide flippase family protein [Shewanella benthica]MCL1063857.1 oligosaccharide flippase family protein [Shewanella benthica]
MPVLDNVQQENRNGLTKSLFSLGSAQVLGRIIRFASSIFLARLLTPEIFGEVAIILACFELISAPTIRFTSDSLLKMDDMTFHSALASAHKMNWCAAVIAFVAMSLLSWPLAYFFQDPTLIPPMILMATSYLLFPFGMLHATSNLKENKIPVVGQAILWQTIADGVLTACLVLLGLGIWAIIIPKVLGILIWVGIHRYHTPLVYGSDSQSPPAEHVYYQNHSINSRSAIETSRVSHQVASLPPMEDKTSKTDIKNLAISIKLIANLQISEEFKKITHKLTKQQASTNEMLHLGVNIGLHDLSIALRNNIDYLLVGYFFGLEALGVYFFAFAASVGLSTIIMQKYSHSQYSQLLKLTFPIIVLQIIFAPIYLPFIYGEHWIHAGALPVFILLCLCGLIRPFAEAASQRLVNLDMQSVKLKFNIGVTLLLVLSISFFSQWGLEAVALGVLLVHLFTTIALTRYVHCYILKPSTYDRINHISNNQETPNVNEKTAKSFAQEFPHDA